MFRNALWNLIGSVAPLLVAFFAIPLLVEQMGTSRFGILTLAWMVVGYFSLFDLGLGRAITKLVAEKLGKGHDDQVASLVWTGVVLMGGVGIVASLLLASLTRLLVENVLNIPAELANETITAFYILAVILPVIVTTTGLRGTLEAHQRFGLVNMVRLPLGIVTFLGPVAVLPFSKSLVPIVAVLAVARLIAWVIYIHMCSRVLPELSRSVALRASVMRPLLSFGGWMTVSNVVGPVILYLDRFLLGVTVTMAAVAYYATPFEVITKLWVIPIAVVSALFPALAFALEKDRNTVHKLFLRAQTYIFIAMFPVTFGVVLYSKDLLSVWLGEEFANNSWRCMQIMAIGVFVNSAAQVASALIQALGHPDVKAKIHLIELPFFVGALYYLVTMYGPVGAAVAFTSRLFVDFMIFMFAAGVLYPEAMRPIKASVISTLVGALVMIAVVMFSES